ncbi:MAG: hypothetical protein IAF38_06110, partial [Bacteroidia bacterium]|nr:hypothetical protein [Bacteroidia bacterium]
MKNKLLLAIPFFILLLVSCGPEKGKENEMRSDSVANAKPDSVPKKVFNDPTVPPTPEYSGDHVVKYPNGITQYRGFFRFGKRHGTWATFFDTGELWGETSYDNGKKEGKSVVYFKNGKVKYEGFYKNDKQSGTWKFYDEAGTLVKE